MATLATVVRRWVVQILASSLALALQVVLMAPGSGMGSRPKSKGLALRAAPHYSLGLSFSFKGEAQGAVPCPSWLSWSPESKAGAQHVDFQAEAFQGHRLIENSPRPRLQAIVSFCCLIHGVLPPPLTG